MIMINTLPDTQSLKRVIKSLCDCAVEIALPLKNIIKTVTNNFLVLISLYL